MRHDIVQHTLQAVRKRLIDAGAAPTHVDQALGGAAVEVRRTYGGDTVYVAAQGRSARDGALCADHAAGHNIATLAQRYALTPRRVRQILSCCRAEGLYTAQHHNKGRVAK